MCQYLTEVYTELWELELWIQKGFKERGLSWTLKDEGAFFKKMQEKTFKAEGEYSQESRAMWLEIVRDREVLCDEVGKGNLGQIAKVDDGKGRENGDCSNPGNKWGWIRESVKSSNIQN